MPHTPHNHSHRRKIARIYLACILTLLVGANAFIFKFAFYSQDMWRNFIGLLFGDLVSSILLIVGVWRRIGWSRYVLIGLNWLMLVILALTGTYLGSEPRFGWRHAGVMFGPPLLLFIAANTWLIKSKRIRHLVTPPGSGG